MGSVSLMMGCVLCRGTPKPPPFPFEVKGSPFFFFFNHQGIAPTGIQLPITYLIYSTTSILLLSTRIIYVG